MLEQRYKPRVTVCTNSVPYRPLRLIGLLYKMETCSGATGRI